MNRQRFIELGVPSLISFFAQLRGYNNAVPDDDLVIDDCRAR